MVEISVIIPVYNVENYLDECLLSISNQTFKDIEIICVDDGSKDNSLKILKEHAKNDSRFKIITQENLGPGAARNKGISMANGKYVYFIDSDDILELNALEELHQIAEEKNTDMIFFKLINFDDETKIQDKKYYYDMPYLKKAVGDKVFNYNDIKEYIFDLPVSIPAKFFKKEFIEGITIPEGIFFEDNIFFIEAIFKSKRLFFHDKYLYNRRVRSNSITKSFDEKYLDFLKMHNLLFEKLKQLDKYEEYKDKFYKKKLFVMHQQFILLNEKSKPEIFDAFKKDLLSYKNEYESDNVFLKEINEYLRCIYYSCIDSDTYKEFELKVENFDLKQENEKLKKTNKRHAKTIKKQKNFIDKIESSKSYKLYRKINGLGKQ